MNGEAVVFWLVAPLAVLGALGLVFSRKAVHGALSLAVTMISLAFLYLAQEAPFLGVVQIVVYTGAIMMVFLFVIMLVGVDAADSRVETIRGQRLAAGLAVIGVVILLGTAVGRATLPDPEPAALAAVQPQGNVPAVADAIFGTYIWAFEAVAALLITAAVGAVALTHRERIFGRRTQKEMARRRFREGRPQDAAGLPVPGVYARHNAVDTPALLPDGTPSEASVPRALVARGAARPASHFALSGAIREQMHDEPSPAAAEAAAAGSTDGAGPAGEPAAETAGQTDHSVSHPTQNPPGGDRP